jgi:tetratricopeptide (TPR) repeat protein
MKKFYDIRREPQEDGTESADNKEDMTESAISTFYITFRRIQELCPLAINFLKLIAFLDPRAVPELFLTESGLDGAKDSLLFNQARGYLFDFSLISRNANPKTYDIHRLVHLAMETYALQHTDKAINWKGRALDIVSRLFPPGEYKEFAISTAYLPHALAVLRHADESKTNSVKLFKNLGMYFFRMGQYCKALEWHERALDGSEKALGRDHPHTLSTVHNMASVFKNQGEYIKALEWYQHALDGNEKTLGRDYPHILTTVNSMAAVFNYQREYIKALEWYQRALDGNEKTLGRDHPHTLTTVHNMASVLKNQGEYIKALEWYQRAFDGRERTLGSPRVHDFGVV